MRISVRCWETGEAGLGPDLPGLGRADRFRVRVLRVQEFCGGRELSHHQWLRSCGWRGQLVRICELFNFGVQWWETGPPTRSGGSSEFHTQMTRPPRSWVL